MPGPTGDSLEFDYVPTVTKPTHEYGQEWGTTGYKDEFLAPRVYELLKSYQAFTQRGVTLAGGQGVLPTGCCIAQQTSTQLYFVYNAAASDGTQTVLGVLRDSRDTGSGTNGISGSGQGGTRTSPSGKVATPCLGNMVVRGILDLTLLSGTDTTSLISVASQVGGGIGSAAAGAITQLKARTDTANALFIF